MGNKNYSKFSQHLKNKAYQNNEPIDGQITIDEITKHNSEAAEVMEPIVATAIEPIIESVIGVVNGCEKLNMRKDSNKESDVVATIAKGTELTINLTESTEEFYKVCTAAGLEGYCMKKFINVK